MKLSIQMKKLEHSAVSDLLNHATAWFIITAPGDETNNGMFNKFVERLNESDDNFKEIAQSYDGLEGSGLMFYMSKGMLYAVMLPSSVLKKEDIGKQC